MLTWSSKNLKKLPVGITAGEIKNINENSFIISPYTKAGSHDIWKYDAISDNLQPLSVYSESLNTRYHSVCYIPEIESIFLFTPSSKAPIVLIDINTKALSLMKYFDQHIMSIRYPCLLCIDGDIHLFGGTTNSKHIQWNYKTKSFKYMYDFVDDMDVSEGIALYLRSKKVIVCIGGDKENEDDFFSVERDCYSKIYISNLGSNEWKMIQEKCPWKVTMAAVLTSDENHVIIAGIKGDDEGDDIYVLNIKDLDNVTLSKSKIKCPKPGLHHLLKSGDIQRNELLVMGYIRNLFNSDEFHGATELPMEILMLIVKWHHNEMIHWIEWNSKQKENEHYEISVSSILSNLE